MGVFSSKTAEKF